MIVSGVTAISPLFFISWPMLLVCVPALIRVARAKNDPTAYRWSLVPATVVLGFLWIFCALLVPLLWDLEQRTVYGSSTRSTVGDGVGAVTAFRLWSLAIGAFFIPWAVSSWRALRWDSGPTGS